MARRRTWSQGSHWRSSATGSIEPGCRTVTTIWCDDDRPIRINRSPAPRRPRSEARCGEGRGRGRSSRYALRVTLDSADHHVVDRTPLAAPRRIRLLLSRRLVTITGCLGASAGAFAIGLVVVLSSATLTVQEPIGPFKTTSLERHLDSGPARTRHPRLCYSTACTGASSTGSSGTVGGRLTGASTGSGSMSAVTSLPIRAPTPPADTAGVDAGLSTALIGRHSGRNRLGVRGTRAVRADRLRPLGSGSGVHRAR